MYTIYPFIHPCLPHSKNPINASYCYQCDKKKKKKSKGRVGTGYRIFVKEESQRLMSVLDKTETTF